MNSYIFDVPGELKPRERLLAFGEKALSNQELLAILLRTGTKKKPVLKLAAELLEEFGSLYELKRVSLEEFQKIEGIGEVKAIELKAAIELGQRIAQEKITKGQRITSTDVAARLLQEELKDLQQEHLMALFLNSRNEVIRKKVIFIGTVNHSVAHPREIFKEAVKYPTSRIIICHNHPSGNLEPSFADLQFTKRIISCGELMGIEILDHLIVGDGYLSLRETTDLFD